MFKRVLLNVVFFVINLCGYNFLCSMNNSIDNYRYLFDLSNQVMISRALYVAADVELADYLDQPLSLQQLAERTHINVYALERLLRFLMEHEIFAYDKNNLVCNTSKSVFLCKNHPQTIRPFILHDDPTRWNAIGCLGESIKTGKPSFDILYHTDYFSYLKNDPILSDRFDQAMTIISQKEDSLIGQRVHFEGIVADIGGGKGQLLQSIAEHNNQVTHLILFDLPHVHDNLVSQNIPMKQIAGSFFDPIQIQADVFILKRILHDWDNEKALQILCNVAHAMNENSTLYIVDAVIDECANKKLILDIDLRLLTIFGGQERTKLEFENLCLQAGLEIVSIQELTDISHIIECRKI